MNAVEEGEFVRCAVDHAFSARAVVAADVDDQGVVEFAEIVDGLDDPADLIVGVRKVRPVDVHLFGEELFLFPREGIPLRQFLRPRRQLGIGRHDAEPLLVGEDRVAQLVPAAVEQMHIADFLDPLRRRMVRRVGAAWDVVDEDWLVRRDGLELLHVLDGLVGHSRGEVPGRFSLEGIDRCRIAVQVRLPLARIAAHEAVEIFKAHPVRPLIERPGLGRLIEGRVVVLAKPRSRVAVLLQDRADGAILFPDDRVVTWETRSRLRPPPQSRPRDGCAP